MSDETLSKAELELIERIIGALGLSSFRDLLWKKVEQAFRFTFKNTRINYGFAHATPDPLTLKYLEERVFILSDKTRDRLTGNMRWELLEGIRNTESISDIKKRLDKVFTGMHDYEIERIARTETLNAMNAGRLEAYKSSEVTHYKMWRAAINNKRTAADSKRLHGQIQELDDPFVDPKTGEGVMHPPNRPNCRCTMIPLRKLPENVVRKGGQMYAADEMVGKIEIDIWSLSKSEKRVWVKPTSKRKGHYRKSKGVKSESVKPREHKSSHSYIKNETGLDVDMREGEKLTTDSLMGDQIIVYDENKNRLDVWIKETSAMIQLSTIGAEDKGTGIGTKYLLGLKDYADVSGKKLVIPDMTLEGKKYFSRFNWLVDDYVMLEYVDGGEKREYWSPNTMSYTPKI